MSEHGKTNLSNEDAGAELEPVEDPRVKLQRKLLEETTTYDRLDEISRISGLPPQPSKTDKSWLEDAPNEELVRLLKDSTIPLEILEKIYEISKNRKPNTKAFPPKDD